jgi:glycosyltransferase involved in cell wall biosynthesis
LTGAAQSRPAAAARRTGVDTGKRIAYVQYTNPAGYPPLEHSSRILAEAGWDVLFLGAAAWGAASLRFPKHPRIRVRAVGNQKSGWRQKLHYLYFCVWCLGWLARNRTSWVYASDLFSCPVGMLASMFGIPLIYHEHDSPDPNPTSAFLRVCLWARGVCARRARLCILPNSRRATSFAEQTRSQRTPMVIWNCPLRGEVAGAPRSETSPVCRFLYHGSIVPDRLPIGVVDALAGLPPQTTLTVVGYETAGSKGYLKRLHGRAVELGIEGRLNLVGSLVGRQEVLDVCRRHDVGLALMPLDGEDLNLQAMTGASNKPFDYLSNGLALLVSQLPDWLELFVEPGYAIACDPSRLESLQAAMRWFIDHPREARAMGEKGRQCVLREWNYESQFGPALELLQSN